MRRHLLAQVSDKLGGRSLVWAGLRGSDMESLSDLPQWSAAFSIIDAYRQRATVDSLAFEDITGERVDLETWDIDDCRHEPPAQEFRRALLRALSRDSALLPYRPSSFLSAIWFARRDRCLHLGLFGAQQSAFEHKPWVEASLQDVGVATIPWIYVANEERDQCISGFSDGPMVLRTSRTSGGRGFSIVHSVQELLAAWPETSEGIVSVAPYLQGTLPLNIGATVWEDGVTMGYPSFQLIGTPGCTLRPFGYCGNDFAQVRTLPATMIDRIEVTTERIGQWLRMRGYRGTFGVDYLIDRDGELRFTEINPRFQGSTVASGRLAVEGDEPCLLLEHVAAMLALPKPPTVPLRERVAATVPLSQLVVHWTGAESSHIDSSMLEQSAGRLGGWCDVHSRPTLQVHPHATVCRLTFRRAITSSGYDLENSLTACVSDWYEAASNANTSEAAR